MSLPHDEVMNMNMYEEWLELSMELRRIKGAELKLRKKICEDVLEEKLEGAKTENVIKGKYKLTATAKLNRTVDRSLLEAIWEDLSDTEKECIDYKPSLKLVNYKKVEELGGKLLDAVTVKPGTPSLKIVENV